uniref:CSON003601 protein n=1 Tax=Culicoides sonorensis TaxID=179676 RepID=A0A336MRI5_CULSO
MSILYSTMTWIGNNKLVTGLSVLLFIFFVSTIAMAVQKGEWEEKYYACEKKYVTTTPTPPTTTPAPSSVTESSEQPSTQSSTESSTNAPATDSITSG